MKKILSIITLIMLGGYILFAAIIFCRKPSEQVCQGILMEISDSMSAGYMNAKDVTGLLIKNNLDPTGQPLEEVRLRPIEVALESSPLIASCECYKTISGHVMIEVKYRRPILRIINDNHDSYYLDEKGEIIEHIAYAVYVPIATGHITRKFAQEELYTLAQYLQDEELWNAQIEQIHVTSHGEIELIPRVGNHIIVLGLPNDYARKFDKLLTFYEEGLNKIGWDRYSRISVDFNNQVVATKREP